LGSHVKREIRTKETSIRLEKGDARPNDAADAFKGGGFKGLKKKKIDEV